MVSRTRRKLGGKVGTLDRRQALVTFGAASFGILAAGVPDFFQDAVSGTPTPRRSHVRGDGEPTPAPTHTHKDPGYAHGVQPLVPGKPIRKLSDLTPPPPATAVALTLDDGPHPKYTPMMLDLLAEFKVPATFSLIGNQVAENTRLVNRLIDDGHQVSNHTMTHPLNLPRLGSTQITEEIVGCYDRISQTTGIAPKFFRSPGGNWSPAVIETAAERGMTCIDWTVDPRDWDQPRSTVSHITTVLSAAKPGDILLSHDGGGIRQRTIDALRTVIPDLQSRGYTFIAL